MKRHVDEKADALYLRLDDSAIVESEEVSPGVVLDYNEANQVAGIELLYLSKWFPNLHDDDVIYTQSTPISLSTLQRQVLDGLRRVETEKYRLGDWYLGALYALRNPHNPDHLSQAAHSLRELVEKLPRVVTQADIVIYEPGLQSMRVGIFKRLKRAKKRYGEVWKGKEIDAQLDKALRKTYRYMELNQKPTRKDQIQIAIREIDPLSDQMGFDIQERKRDEIHALLSQLEYFAHHGSSTHTNKQEFSKHVAILEQMVYDLLAPVTAQDQQEIQSILDRTERSDADAESLYKLITKKGANYVFFFSNSTDSGWISFLEGKGFFRSPPNAKSLSEGRIQYPFWPELQYLKNVCKDAPEEVIQLVLQLPEVDNPRVYENILDIALELKGERSARLKPKMLEYAKLEHQFWTWAHKYPELLTHWTAEDQTEAALELANILVQFAPDPQAEEKQTQRREIHGDEIASMMALLNPAPRFDDNYQQILDEGVRPLAEKEPYRVARILIDATASMIRHGLHREELESGTGQDYSETKYPRLNRQSWKYQDSEETLVHTLTHACEKVYEQAPEPVAALDDALREHRWDIFKRLRQHLYALHPSDQTKPWIRELILTHGDYAKWEHHYEFQRMIRLACEHFGAELLTEDERTEIFDAILSGSSREDFRESRGEQFTEADFERRKQYFHRQQLRPFAPVLFGEYADYFRELEDDKNADEITDKSYSLFGGSGSEGGSVTSRSPRSFEEFSNLSDEELLAYINEWQNERPYEDDGLIEINIPALAGAFQSVFTGSIVPDDDRLEFWIEKNRERVERPIYVRSMIQAMQEDVKGRNFDRLERWFDFCQWVLSRPDEDREEPMRHGDTSRTNPSWRSSRRAVGDFVEVCLKREVEVPISAREKLAGLLDTLCTQFDWQLHRGEPVVLNQDDPLTDAINSTRGRALDNLVKFGHWVRRHDAAAKVPEMTAILEKRFSSKTEYPLTIPEHALLGMRYGRIGYMDEAWAIARKSDFFPQDNITAWVEAFGNFLSNCDPHKPTFYILRDDYEFALEHLSNLKRKWADDLGHDLFTYYLWEVYPLKGDESLLERYYRKTNSDRKRWATLFYLIGRTLRNSGTQLDEGLKDRIMAFFEWRFQVGEPTEFHNFAFWLEAECLKAEWRLKAYSRILDRGYVGQEEHRRTLIGHDMQALREMLPKHTALVVECFDKLIGKKITIYQTDDAEAILKAGLEYDDENVHEKARRAYEKLLKDGHFELLDLND